MQNPVNVDEYIRNSGNWQNALILLRDLFLNAGLNEEIKWGGPVYTYKGRNVAGMGYFKYFVSIWFYQGALLKDSGKKLICAQEGVTQALRQWRFNKIEEIEEESETIASYILESMANQDAGKIVPRQVAKPLEIPKPLQDAFKRSKVLLNSFEKLPLTKKRDYVDFIATARNRVSVESRMKKIIPMIKEGKGLNDKYRK